MRITWGVVLMVLVLASTAGAREQQYPGTGGSGIQQPGSAPRHDIDPNPLSPEQQAQMDKGRNNDRQRHLVADTERLLVLANQLKVDVGKSTKDTLSIDVIKKADEIEKLAHSVKERMKG